MRKLMSVLLSAVLLWVLASPAQAAQPALRVFLDGAQVNFDVEPLVENGRTLVPVRALSEALGFEVGWDDAEQRVTLTRGSTVILLRVDETQVLVNGKAMQLDVPVRKVGSRTLIPLRFVSETLGAHVAWNGDDYSAAITSGQAVAERVLASLQKPANQKSRGKFSLNLTLHGDGIPGGGITIPTDMGFTTHLYNNEMYANVNVQPAMGPAMTTEIAAMSGRIFVKESASAPWTEAGTYNPENLNETSALTGFQGFSNAHVQAEMLSKVDLRVSGTVEVDGVQALQVTTDLTTAGLDKLLTQQMMASLPAGMPDSTDFGVNVERFVITYVVHPETGFIYQIDLDLLAGVSVGNASSAGEMIVAMTGSVTAQPVSEPIQFPADLSK